MEEYQVFIAMIPVSSLSDGRADMDKILGEKFENREAVEKAICFNEFDPMATEELLLVPIHEFTDWLNDQDNDTPEEEKFNVFDKWFSHVLIKKQ